MPRFVGYIKNDRYAIGCTGQTVYVYDQDGAELARFKDIKYGYTPKFCPNKDIFVVKSTAGQLAFYSLSELQLLKKFYFSKVHAAQDDGFCFSPDGAYLYNVESHPGKTEYDGYNWAVGVYSTEDFSLVNRYFLTARSLDPTHVEYDAQTDTLFILGIFRQGGSHRCFVSKLVNGAAGEIRYISEKVYDFYTAFNASKMHGFSPLDCEFCMLKYMDLDPMDYADKEYPLSELWAQQGQLAQFKPFGPEDYDDVCAFLVELNREQNLHINWNWARWEWMYFHPYTDQDKLSLMGIWRDDGRIVGTALFDMYPGEVLCAVLPGYEELLPEILRYARENLSNDCGLGVAVRDDDQAMISLLLEQGFQKGDQTEPMLRISLLHSLEDTLPEGLHIQEVHFPEDYYAYQFTIWQGFGHGNNVKEFEESLCPDVPQYPHWNSWTQLAAVDENGNFVAICGCWCHPDTHYAYVEPVCVIPDYQGKGVGSALVKRTLNHCRGLWAEEAFVLSDMDFYKKIGFQPYPSFTFYWK